MFQAESNALLAAQNADVILLSEVDCGMARTSQRHTTAEVASALSMTYAYGVEFFEMGLGEGPELAFRSGDTNDLGFHGNAVLSRTPIERAALIRLDDDGRWFVMADGQPRIGGRIAIAAMLPWNGRQLCVVSTHLESHSGADHRGVQWRRLLDAVDTFAGGAPVLIGGDLNTGNHVPDGDWRQEGLFENARARGYSWDATPEGLSTRRSRLSERAFSRLKLDWFAHRGLGWRNKAMVSALDDAGEAISDHDLVRADFLPAEPIPED